MHSISVILNLHLPYDRKIARGIAAYMQDSERISIYVEEDPWLKMPEKSSWHGDGLIVSFDDPKIAEFVRNIDDIPCIGIGGGGGWFDPECEIPYFGTDDKKIGEIAADHLLERGFKNFAFCGYKPTRINQWSQDRGSSFQWHLAEHDMTCHMFEDQTPSARYWDELQQSLKAWLGSLPTPLGLMAANDIRARHAIEACHSLGLRIPDDVAVIGVDNDELICALSRPPLSSVEQGAYRLGYEAASLLVAMIEGKAAEQSRSTFAPSGIVTRQSTDTLAVTDREVADAVRFIRNSACTGIIAQNVVDEIGATRSSLDLRFKKTIGRSISQEIQRCQLERAKKLITTTGFPLKQIARLTGYSSPQYLSAIIRKATGRTPLEYRDETSAVESHGSDSVNRNQ